MKKMKFILAFLILGLCLSSCIEDDNFADELKESPMVYGFDSPGESYIILPADTQVIEDSFKVELIGGATGTTASTDMTFVYEIASSTTAVEGVNFEILNTSNTFTIPANREFSETELEITIDPTSFTVGENSQIVINLIPLDASVATATPFAPLVLSIDKCDPALSGTYNVSGIGAAINPTISPNSCSTYRIDYLPGFSSIYWWEVSHNETTGEITITDWQFESSNPLTGSGILNTDGTMTFTGMTVDGVGFYQNRTFDLIP